MGGWGGGTSFKATISIDVLMGGGDSVAMNTNIGECRNFRKETVNQDCNGKHYRIISELCEMCAK